MTAKAIELELNSIYDGFVSVENVANHSRGDVTLAICDMRYNDTGDSVGIKQTVILLQAPDLDFPEFTMRSPGSSLLGSSSLSFTDSPEFDALYSVHGTLEEAIHVLFSTEVREQLTALPGWEVRGNGRSLVVYQPRKIFKEDGRTEFMSTALQILQTLRTGEAELDARPDVCREATGADLLESAQPMDGLVGSMMLSLLQQMPFSEDELAFTEDELETFCNASCPRAIPRGMDRQILGASKNVYIIGLTATIVPGFCSLGLWFGEAGWAALVPLSGTLIGQIVFLLGWNFRRRKIRTLQYGTIVPGIVEKVLATDVQVNDQLRHHAVVFYQVNGRSITARQNVYGQAADRAKRRAADQTEVRVLVDPQDPKHVIVVDLLIVF